ncbi:MAG: ROK family protein [Candidatus Neptunochlamydia sp.]|nr:ROK family protein [Candidatus Neptunochlamydia sp.]
MNLIGIDIGGTKVSICLGDSEGNIHTFKRVETSTLRGPDTGLPKLVELIGHLIRDENIEIQDIKGIGLAVPGPVSTKTERILTPPNMPKWVNVPIAQYLREKLDRPVFMDNDANAGALGEWKFGAAKHVNNLVYLTMSTGMGGGIIVNGKIIQGETDTGGEVGHFVLDPKGPKCACGQNGCFEAFCGGASVSYLLQEEIKKDLKSMILKEAEGKIEAVDMKCLLAAVKKRDPFALEFWEGYTERLAQGVGILLQTLNPDAIILGTIAAHNKELVMDPLNEALPRYAWEVPLKHCRIEPTTLGSNLGKLGALALAIHGLQSREN